MFTKVSGLPLLSVSEINIFYSTCIFNTISQNPVEFVTFFIFCSE